MYKVMLVDDEVGVRNSIKAKINWAEAGYQIVLEAANGEEALRLLGDYPLPDLVISDIRMPQMDGISFMKACHERYPRLRTVVLSGYSDFEYLKSAIQYGAKDYLLKPVVRSELSELLSRIAKELDGDRHRRQEEQRDRIRRDEWLQAEREQLLLQLVKNEWLSITVVKERLEQLQLTSLAMDGLHAQFVTAEMRVPDGRLEGWDDRMDLLALSFQMLGRELANRWGDIYCFQDVSRPSMLFFLLLHSERIDSKGRAARFVHEFKNGVKQYLRLDCVLGIGESIHSLKEFKNGYASSILDWSQRTVRGPAGGQGQPELTNAFQPEVERKLVNAIESLDMRAFSRHLKDVFGEDRDTPMFSFTFLTLRIILILHSVAKKFEAGDSSLQQYLWNCQMSVNDFVSREQVLEQLHLMAEKVMGEVRKTRFSGGQKLAEAIRLYVDENYSYELTLSSLAEMFHLNETYLSSLFKQNAGLTFSDYVTNLRLTKAEQLLRENELKLTDIATLVGYSSSSYFSTSFKKHYGVSPKEYRDQHATGESKA
ncbi:response regulator transcription factor [Cohnella candidum]|uniref:Response regulator n=1 Tax=Cohnella candidum TaxID=2674991 RepID=A0A3G3K1V3_9BACL|nr:helix-turn-helix domain-containing protein [Cohnella candidum]AYQ73739.1 response regulator [Cohnella candidum]